LPGVVLEFAPTISGKGPNIHFIAREPSRVRLELAYDPRLEEARKPCSTAQDIQRVALSSRIRVIVGRGPPPTEACPKASASASPSRSAAIK
jgi:hypothetical protein